MEAAKPKFASSLRTQSEFIDGLVIEHGPIELLGRFFLRAASELAKLDLTLVWLDAEELQRANRQNRDSWLPMLPTFDRDFSALDASNFRAVGVR
ncbi:MAG: hypothetical protein F9K44_14235, partial [Hyphomicrobiaceae bacterium]